MCGINGFTKENKALIERMNEVTHHRGPDGTGTFVADGISLGNNRLSIIDLSTAANQPMYSADGRFVIVYNGELYNFKELKEQCTGYPFTTQSDTEVILASFEKWGRECVEHFNGIFAFALWDRTNKELFLARDHMGIKPLYYYFENGLLVFSSEIKAILEHGVPRVLDEDSFTRYLHLLYTPGPATLFKGINKLPAGTYGVFHDGTLSLTRYFEPALHEGNVSKKDLLHAVRNTVSNAVVGQMISDRPVGVYLSGGIDSSIVLASLAGGGASIDTFSVGFTSPDGTEQSKYNDDFFLARKTAAHFGSRHHEVMVGPRDVTAHLEDVVWHLDEPIASPTAFARLVLAGFSKQKVDVVLGGDGGDELFGGYDRYRMSARATLFQQMLGSATALLPHTSVIEKLLTPQGAERFMRFMFQKQKGVEMISPPRAGKEVEVLAYLMAHHTLFSEGTPEEMLMDADVKMWLVDSALLLTDKMTMAKSLEARVPFLDRSVVDLAATIPARYKVGPFGSKKILKEAFRDVLPAYLFHQPKRGWFSPGAKWLRDAEVFRMAEAVISPTYNRETGNLFAWETLREMLYAHKDHRAYHSNTLWAVIFFQVWARRFKVKCR